MIADADPGSNVSWPRPLPGIVLGVVMGCKFRGCGRGQSDKKFTLSLTIKGRGSRIENVSTSHPYSLILFELYFCPINVSLLVPEVSSAFCDSITALASMLAFA